MSKKYVVPLSKDTSYKRPKVTKTEQLTAKDISDKLEGYVQIDKKEIPDLEIGVHMRYFNKDADGNQQFRSGGFLKNKDNWKKWIILSNGKNSWSVQTDGAIFFKKMTRDEETEDIHKMYKKKLAEKDEIINKLKKYIKMKIHSQQPSKTTISKNTGSKSDRNGSRHKI